MRDRDRFFLLICVTLDLNIYLKTLLFFLWHGRSEEDLSIAEKIAREILWIKVGQFGRSAGGIIKNRAGGRLESGLEMLSVSI